MSGYGEKKLDIVKSNILEENYHISKISGVMKANDCTSYLVDWEPSWVCENQLVGCEDLIEIYKDNNTDEILDGGDGENGQSAAFPPPPKKRGMSLKKISNNDILYLNKQSSGSYCNERGKSIYHENEKSDQLMRNANCAAHVCAVIGVFYGKDSYTYYRVKWLSTWEKEEKLSKCEELIKLFYQEIGISKAGLIGNELVTVKEEPLSPGRIDNSNICNDHMEQLRESNMILKAQLHELEDIQMKYRFLEENFEQYRKEKDNEIEILLKRNSEARDKSNKFKAKLFQINQNKLDEVRYTKLLLKQNERHLNDQLQTLRMGGQEKLEILEKKCQDYKKINEQTITEKDFQIKLMTTKHVEVQCKFEKYKSYKEKDILLLRKKLDDCKSKFIILKKQKEFEIAGFTRKFDQKSEELEEAQSQNDILVEEIASLTDQLGSSRREKEIDYNILNQKIIDLKKGLTQLDREEELKSMMHAAIKKEKDQEIIMLKKDISCLHQVIVEMEGRISEKDQQLLKVMKKIKLI